MNNERDRKFLLLNYILESKNQSHINQLKTKKQ